MPRRKSHIIGLVLLLLIIVGWVFYVRPLKDRVADLHTSQSEKEVILIDLTKQADELKELSDSIPQDEAEKQRLLLNIPTSIEQYNLIQYFDSISRNYNLHFNNMNFIVSNDLTEEVGKIEITASFEGEKEDISDFFKVLEKSSRRIIVKSFQLRFDKDGNSVFDLQMEAYYQKV